MRCRRECSTDHSKGIIAWPFGLAGPGSSGAYCGGRIRWAGDIPAAWWPRFSWNRPLHRLYGSRVREHTQAARMPIAPPFPIQENCGLSFSLRFRVHGQCHSHGKYLRAIPVRATVLKCCGVDFHHAWIRFLSANSILRIGHTMPFSDDSESSRPPKRLLARFASHERRSRARCRVSNGLRLFRHATFSTFLNGLSPFIAGYFLCPTDRERYAHFRVGLTPSCFLRLYSAKERLFTSYGTFILSPVHLYYSTERKICKASGSCLYFLRGDVLWVKVIMVHWRDGRGEG